MTDCIFVSFSLHQELRRTKEEGDHEDAANLTSQSASALCDQI